MAQTRGDLVLLADVKTYLNTALTTDDSLLTDIIRSVTNEVQNIARRHFLPRMETRLHDTPGNYDLMVNDDLLEVITLLNGSGDALTTSQYQLYPLNGYPKNKVTLLPGNAWQISPTVGPFGAILLTAIWAYHDNYSDAWRDDGATLAAAISSTSAGTFTTSFASFKAGQLIRVDDEIMSVVSIAGSTAPYTVTMYRGCNGSTAATHLISKPVYIWTVPYEVSETARQAAAAYYRLRSNPGQESIMLDGAQIVTPKDVHGWVAKRLRANGLIREAFG